MDDPHDQIKDMNFFADYLVAWLLSILVLGVGGLLYHLFASDRQKAAIVLRNLAGPDQAESCLVQSDCAESLRRKQAKTGLAKEYADCSMSGGHEAGRTRQSRITWICISVVIGLSLAFLLFANKPAIFFAVIAASLCLGFLISEKAIRADQVRYKKEIVFYLPVVMERIVMAVQSGLDILPALKAIEQIENKEDGDRSVQKDEVTRLLSRVISLCESGLSFDQSLHSVADSVKSSALRHCFIHLAVAHKEGGELIYPLKELSDATQLYFQESIEEEIAKMPIKATLPLLLTFAGLIVIFMTGPVVQIMNVSVNPRLATEETRATQATSVRKDTSARRLP